ncbi:MAG: chemoreceptor glutamine deamidase CheD [Pseudomonadota bacterium]
MVLPSSRRDKPPTLPGFENIHSMWSPEFNQWSYKIAPGEYFITKTGEYITTVLGSCISACIRDPQTGIGGMNHFMLPGDNNTKTSKLHGINTLATRYGVVAMKTLIHDVIEHGACRDRLELKLFGGGAVLEMQVNSIGDRNIAFARRFAASEGLQIVSEDMGGRFARKVNYFPQTGRVMVKRLRAMHKRAIQQTEQTYQIALHTNNSAFDLDQINHEN